MKQVLSFSDQSKSFTYGVEFGRLLEKMERGDIAIRNNGFPVREENKHVIERACLAFGYIPSFGKSEDGWIDFIGIKNIVSEN